MCKFAKWEADIEEKYVQLCNQGNMKEATTMFKFEILLMDRE